MDRSLFQSFFMGGFECSCHCLRSGKRLDLIDATQHDRHLRRDYQRLQAHKIHTVREGIRWPRIETSPYHYDFSSVLPMVRAARTAKIQVIWDLFHYGWPADLDIFQPEFVRRFRTFVTAFAYLLSEETDEIPFIVPVNEISYFSWAAGDVGYLNPFAFERSYELKVQLVCAALEAIEAIWEVLPEARIVHPDPVINVVTDPDRPEDRQTAEGHRLAQFQAWDMIAGMRWPLLGGSPEYLDIIGVNYYDHNQWLHNGPFLEPSHPLYRPFSEILIEVYNRYGRPLFISETGIEGDLRPQWFNYICEEVRTAMNAGVPVEGICLYPICDYPGWDDERLCQSGLWGYADERGEREVHTPLAREVHRQQKYFATFTPAPAPTQAVANGQAESHTEDSDKITICLFTDSLDPSGMGEHMLTLATHLRQRYQILFVCPPGERGDPFLKRAEALGCTVLPLIVQDNATAVDVLRQQLRRRDVKIFHCHAGIGWEGHEGIRAARHSGLPLAIVRTEHLPYLLTEPCQRAEHAALLPLVDQLICVSAAAAKSFIEAGVPAEKLTVVRNGIQPERPEPDRAGVRAEFGLPAEAQIVLTVARMTAQKGHCYLLKAIPAIVAQAPDAYFIWVGEGPLEGDLRRQMQTLNVRPPRLTLAGRRTDVPRLLAAADLFVLPSLFEGLPLVVLEAMAASVPVIGTRVCGTEEAITDSFSGRLVEPQHSAALAESVVEALTQPQLTARWVHESRARFELEFSAARMADETVALYEGLLAKMLMEQQPIPGRFVPQSEIHP
ncbi:MAG: glycosyltransferase [Caldilineaceae bacterium]